MATKSTAPKKFQSLRHFILEKLIEINDATIEAFFPPRYPGTEFARSFLSKRWRNKPPSPKSTSSILNKLREEGLIERKGPKRYAKWNITNNGRKMLKNYRRQLSNDNDLPILDKCENDGILRLVAFDIPEKEREKRNLLRACLNELDFELLQKSVWVGYAPLPEEFIEYLRDINVLKYIHIISAQKGGTILR